MGSDMDVMGIEHETWYKDISVKEIMEIYEM